MIGALVMMLSLWEPSPVDLQWTAPPPCPGAGEVRREIDGLLRRANVQGRSLQVFGNVTRQDGQFDLVLRIEDGQTQAERTLQGPDCAELSKTAALIVAMAIDPAVAQQPSESEDGGDPSAVPEPNPDPNPDPNPQPNPDPDPDPQPQPQPKPKPDPEPDPNPDPQPDPQPDSRAPASLRFRGRLQLGGGFGPLPGLSGVVALGLGLGGQAWRAEVVGHYWTPARGEADEAPGVDVLAQLWSVGARGCYEPGLDRVRFPLCAGLDAGTMIGTARGADVARTRQAPWVAAVGGVGVVWWLVDRVGIGGRADAHAALFRPHFSIDPGATGHIAAPGGIQVLLGVSVRAP